MENNYIVNNYINLKKSLDNPTILSDIIQYANTSKFINKNKLYFIGLVKQNPETDIYYNKIIRHLNRKFKNNKNNSIMIGGMSEILATGIVMGGVSLGLIGLMAFFIYKWINRPKCRIEYPLYPAELIPTPEEVMMKIFPASWLGDIDNKIDMIQGVLDKTQTLYNIVGIFAPSNPIGKFLLNALRLGGSAVVNFFTSGKGAAAIAIFFVISNLINVILEVIRVFIQMLQSESFIKLFYNLIYINFMDGPFGVKCWIEYLIKTHGKDSEGYQLLCQFVNTIFDALAEFTGSMVSMLRPETSGLAYIIVPYIMKNSQKGLFEKVEEELTDTYNLASDFYKNLIQNPMEMKQYLDDKLNGTKDIINKIFFFVKKEVKDADGSFYEEGFSDVFFDAITNNTAMFAIGMNKFMALMFSVIRIFAVCADEKEKESLVDVATNIL